jgi:O-antigen/teichoic acid export membrane protein
MGIDRAIGYTVLARGWSALAGLATVALIARSLSPVEQGYYYTFGSLVALQIVFELGFSVVILQLAAHEVAHLKLGPGGIVSGPPVAHARLASIFRKAIKWYSIAAIVMACLLIPIGWHFFAATPDPHYSVAWRLPWVAVVLASSVTFQIDPIFSFLEGCGYVARVARTRLAQSILGSLLAWSMLLLHHGLFAPALLITGQVIAGLVWIASHRSLLHKLFRHPIGNHQIDWWQEVWPFQWRIAVSYACGFFIFQLFNPILFHYWGPVVAGRMGMSLNISNAIASIAIAWISTKAAPFGALIARREFPALDRLFFRSVAQTMVFCSAVSLVVWIVAYLLTQRHMSFAQRLLPPLPFAFLLLSMNINQGVNSMALYLRAHKQEKFLLNSILGAIFLVLTAFLLGRPFGALGMTAGQLCGTLTIGLGLGSYTFFKFRKLWHA